MIAATAAAAALILTGSAGVQEPYWNWHRHGSALASHEPVTPESAPTATAAPLAERREPTATVSNNGTLTVTLDKATTDRVCIAPNLGCDTTRDTITSTQGHAIAATILPTCAVEDDTACHWSAAHQGNNQGDSFTAYETPNGSYVVHYNNGSTRVWQ